MALIAGAGGVVFEDAGCTLLLPGSAAAAGTMGAAADLAACAGADGLSEFSLSGAGTAPSFELAVGVG